MSEIHRDKNGNPMKGAVETSHVIYTHDGGLESHDAKVIAEAVRETEQRVRRSQMEARRAVQRKH